jgi:two-component system, chemotaxis family, response regulator Rcp1
MNRSGPSEPVQILLVEDSPGDIRLTREVLSDATIANELHIVGDGEQAMAFLRRDGEHAGAPRPDLILLDLNLPRKDGREVLAELKDEPELHLIPVIVLTTSAAEQDVLRCYDLKAACYITKPIDLDEFISVVRSIESFWLSIVRLPQP